LGGLGNGLGNAAALFKDIASFIPGIIRLAGKGPTTAKVGSGVSLLGGGLLKLSGSSTKDLFSGDANTLGRIGGGIAGIGSFVSGISQGGLGGVLQTTLGGAEFGAAVAGTHR
jgi:hypothetical protein